MKEKKQEKPLILKIQDVEESIAGIINNSKLPAFILVKIIGNFELELQLLKQKELNTALEDFNKSEEEK